MKNKTKVLRTEQIWLHPNKTLSKLCHLSKNLYNQANYIIKQSEEGSGIRCNELDKILREESENYKTLPAQTAQQILKRIDTSWTSFFRAINAWKKRPEKFKTKPSPPHYKKKNGEHILVLTNQQCKIKDGRITFPKKMGRIEVKTRLQNDTNLREVRIIPRGVGYVCEIVYEKEVEIEEKDRNRIVGIDLGAKNIVTMVNNIGLKPIVVRDDGTGIKSINQFFHKRKAELQSIYDKQGLREGKKQKTLEAKRDRKKHDYIHKLTRFIVDWCVEHKIGTIVFGYNPEWKQMVNIGRRNNQTFTQIPHMEIINKTAYKAEEKGIEVKEQEENHTSKCSFLDSEPVEHHDNYVGKRITRSLFKSAKGIIIHADVNAGYNIVKKANPKAFSNECEWIGGCALHPLCCYITHKGKHSNV
jgi:IS605 OrfB family transposase